MGTTIERAVRDRTGPGLGGLAFDGTPGETWESYRARHAPLAGEILQGLMIYADMRRPRQPAEVVINANAHISGHVSQLAKLLLRLHPAEKETLLARMPAESEERSATNARVIVTARPSQIRSITFADHQIWDLFSEENCPRTWTRSFLIGAMEELVAIRDVVPLGFG